MIFKLPKIVREALKNSTSIDQGFEQYPKVEERLQAEGYDCHEASDHLSTYLTKMLNKNVKKGKINLT